MIIHKELQGELNKLSKYPCFALAQLPTPIHPLENFRKHLNDLDVWIKRDDLSGLEGGGNKTRKLEFLVGDAIENGYDMLFTVGAIQSNHTRQTAASAAKAGLKCALLHCAWTEDAGPLYREVGNILLSSLMGAELYYDPTIRPIDDQGPLDEMVEYLESQGHKPYLIPGGASEHKLGSFGYMTCASEIVEQCKEKGIHFDYVVHCTGSSSTQAGLVAGFAALGEKTHVIGISDDNETELKKKRVLELANEALNEAGISCRVKESDVEVHAFDMSTYGVTEDATFEAMYLMSRTEGLVSDPVYEGKAIRGLMELSRNGRFEKGSRVLLMHIGGSPAIHAYANQYKPIELKKLPF